MRNRAPLRHSAPGPILLEAAGRSALDGEGGFPSPLWGRVRDGGRAAPRRLILPTSPRNLLSGHDLARRRPRVVSFARPPTPTRPHKKERGRLARLSQLGQAGGEFWGWEGAKSESVQRCGFEIRL